MVIFCSFRNEIKMVRELCAELGIKAKEISGSVNSKERSKVQDQFRRKTIQVCVLQFKCGKYGLDLGTSDTTIYYSNSYDYEDRAQSEDRTVVVGKDSPLLYIDLITKDSIDEDIKEAIKEKKTDARYLMARIRIKEQKMVIP